jgi:hypothetical protein
MTLYRKRNPQAVVFRHEDIFRAGVPDTSISRRLTSWWEFKYALSFSRIKWRGAQGAEMMRLWSCGIPAYFVVYTDTKDAGQELRIVPAMPGYKNLQTPHYAPNWNHQFLIQFIERIHGEGR